MIGAVLTTLAGGMLAAALLPAVVGAACGFVAYGRTKLAPINHRPARASDHLRTTS